MPQQSSVLNQCFETVHFPGALKVFGLVSPTMGTEIHISQRSPPPQLELLHRNVPSLWLEHFTVAPVFKN
jgi:hypothetical protein